MASKSKFATAARACRRTGKKSGSKSFWGCVKKKLRSRR